MSLSSGAQIELAIKLELTDYVRASFWVLFRPWAMKIVLVFAVLLLGLFFLRLIEDPNSKPFPALILPALVLFTIGSTYLSAKRNMASNKSVQEITHYTFSEKGIEALAQSWSGHTGWGNVLNAYETKHNFLLFISRNQMYIIPRRCFRDAEQIAAFKQMLVSHMNSKAQIKSG
jgi:hypothetical protein